MSGAERRDAILATGDLVWAVANAGLGRLPLKDAAADNLRAAYAIAAATALRGVVDAVASGGLLDEDDLLEAAQELEAAAAHLRRATS